VSEVAQHVADGLVEHLPVAGLAGELPGVEVDPGQQGLVVEHLLEVGDQPAAVGGVAGEAATQVVVDPAAGHGVEREQRGVEGGLVARAPVVAQEGVDRHGLGELGRPSEPTVALVDLGEQGVGRRGQHLAAGGLRRGGELLPAGDRLGDLLRLFDEVVPARAPQLVDPLAQLGEAEVAAPAHLREVGAGEERTAIGEAEDRHRPPAGARHGLHGVHVHGVDIRALLPVDLDTHEQPVDQRPDLVVLERLVGHHVAPVARRVADRHQDGHVALAGRPPRFLPPREPVHRVVGVLA
jgi:hypothetical protein